MNSIPGLRPNLFPDRDIAPRLFAALHAMSFDGVGITRAAYGPKESEAHALVRAEAERLGLAVEADHAGNLMMTLKGTEPGLPGLMLGSHLDSVRSAGNYDGAAGVLAGLSVVAGLVRAGFRPARDITVIAIRAEETGSWFPVSYAGSRAALGRLPPEALDALRMDDGRTLAEHMREEGCDPDAVRAGRASITPETVAAFVELHIEQGPTVGRAGGAARHRHRHSGVAPVSGRAGLRRIQSFGCDAPPAAAGCWPRGGGTRLSARRRMGAAGGGRAMCSSAPSACWRPRPRPASR